MNEYDNPDDLNDLEKMDGPIATAKVEPKANSSQLFSIFNTAPLGRRMVAFVLDIVVAAIAFWLIVENTQFAESMFAMAKDDYGREVKRLTEAGYYWTTVGVFSCYVVIHFAFGLYNRQTLFKFLFRLKVVKADGTRPSFLHYLLRQHLNLLLVLNPFYAMGPLYAIIDATLLFTPLGKCLHDRWAKTVVVRTEFLDPAERV